MKRRIKTDLFDRGGTAPPISPITFSFIADKVNHQSVSICEICGETAFRIPALPSLHPGAPGTVPRRSEHCTPALRLSAPGSLRSLPLLLINIHFLVTLSFISK
ncbi:hypothetical protein BFAG_01499 [Bacteroides fragilis 3_1_12]|uniref:Uncharacterized protein n=1 Tax=Bacteroides fragilis 3_1_12 TaxID=457424 RepID=A0ABN0BIY0_BACFG|nr:hypothetical protein BFAG_01499 [Bacteroides fragilis 3_1_12]